MTHERLYQHRGRFTHCHLQFEFFLSSSVPRSLSCVASYRNGKVAVHRTRLNCVVPSASNSLEFDSLPIVGLLCTVEVGTLPAVISEAPGKSSSTPLVSVILYRQVRCKNTLSTNFVLIDYPSGLSVNGSLVMLTWKVNWVHYELFTIYHAEGRAIHSPPRSIFVWVGNLLCCIVVLCALALVYQWIPISLDKLWSALVWHLNIILPWAISVPLYHIFLASNISPWHIWPLTTFSFGRAVPCFVAILASISLLCCWFSCIGRVVCVVSYGLSVTCVCKRWQRREFDGDVVIYIVFFDWSRMRLNDWYFVRSRLSNWKISVSSIRHFICSIWCNHSLWWEF